jgi:hypothetical protein
MKMELKIFTYQIENGELVKENNYTDFLFVFNNIISHNFIYENNKLNIIVSTEFPPNDMTYKDKKWISSKNKKLNVYSDFIKFFE